MFDEARQTHHSLMQDPAFAQALVSIGQTPLQLPSGLTLLHQNFMGFMVNMLPRASPPPDLATQLRSVGQHRAPLLLSPEEPARMPRSLRLKAPRQKAVLSLAGGEQACRAQLHSKWRNQLVRGENQDINVSRGRLTADVTTPVLHLESVQSRARRYANWPAALTAAFAAAAPDQTCLFTARQKGQITAHLLFLTHGTTASYHIGHITALGKVTCAHNLLMWHAISYFSKTGFATLDLGLVGAGNGGLDHFKLRTGAQRQMTGGTHLYWRPFAKG